jgi:transcription termination factor Rho
MEVNPYRDDMSSPPENDGGATDNGAPNANVPQPSTPRPSVENVPTPGTPPARHPGSNPHHQGGRDRFGQNGRRGRRGRGRGPRPDQGGSAPIPAVIVAEGEAEGWFDPSRDGGFVRRAAESYLPSPSDAFVPPHLVRQAGLRRGDRVQATVGRDHRGRMVAAEVKSINGQDPAVALRRPEFSSLVASYPDRKLVL